MFLELTLEYNGRVILVAANHITSLGPNSNGSWLTLTGDKSGVVAVKEAYEEIVNTLALQCGLYVCKQYVEE